VRWAWKYVLAVCLILGTGFESLAQPTREEAKDEVELALDRLPVELTVTMRWMWCGDWNGYYFPGLDFIRLCEENLDQGVGAARFIYLHELGHAFTMERHPNFDRWDGNYEAAADEFAAIMAIVQGNPEDLVEIANLYIEWSREHVQRKGDPHPPMELRAKAMRDIYLGFVAPWLPEEHEAYLSALRYWRQEMIEYGDGHN